MPKDPTKNVDRYKIRGGHLNEFDFQQNQEQFVEQRQQESSNLIPGTPPEERAEGLQPAVATTKQGTKKKASKKTAAPKGSKALRASKSAKATKAAKGTKGSKTAKTAKATKRTSAKKAAPRGASAKKLAARKAAKKK